MKSTSCGVLVFDASGELLLGHATGTPYWDIPKGGGEPGERALDTAVREAAEETGWRFAPDHLTDLGVFAYRPKKDLHLFATLVQRFEASTCRCTSHFTDAHGRVRPEMDAYRWAPRAQWRRLCAPSMAKLLLESASLADVPDALGARVSPHMPVPVSPPPSLEPTASPHGSPGR